MELSANTAMGATRVALQVWTKFQRPVLEVYSQFHNIRAPVVKAPVQNHKGENIPGETIDVRHQDLFFDFGVVNLGSRRAENVTIQFRGNQSLFFGDRVPAIVNGRQIAILPPGQYLPLFRIDAHDVERATEGFHLDLHYSAPPVILNWVQRKWSDFRRKNQYRSDYIFQPELYEGYHVPKAEYNG